MIVPECEIRKLGKNAVMPITNTYITPQQKLIPYWHKELDEVIIHRIKCLLDQSDGSKFLFQFDRLYIVVGADTGGRMFRCVLKMVLHSTSTKQTKQYVIKVGHVNCDKDTRIIVENTIGKHINCSLNKLVKKHLFIFRDSSNESPDFDVSLVDENPINDTTANADFFPFLCQSKLQGI